MQQENYQGDTLQKHTDKLCILYILRLKVTYVQLNSTASTLNQPTVLVERSSLSLTKVCRILQWKLLWCSAA